MTKDKKTFRKRKEKIGDFLLDIDKYVITVALFSVLFKDTSNWGTTEYSITVLSVIAVFAMAIFLQEDEPNTNSKKK